MKGTYTIVQTLAGLNYIKEQNSYSKISGSSTNSDGSTTISKGHIQGISFAGSIDNPGITASPDMYATMAFSSYSQSTQSTSANIFTYHWDADSTNNLNATTLTYDSQGNLLGGLIENEYGTGINYAYGYVQAPAENGQKIILTTGSGGAFTTSGSEFHVDGQEGVPLTLNGNSNTVIDTNPISDSGSTSSNISGIIINGSSDVIEATSNFQVTLSSHDTGASGAFGQDFLPTYMGGISFGSISQNSVCSVTAAIQNADGTITGYTGSLSKDENSNDSALISINEGYYSQNGVEFASESILSPTTSAPSQTNETVSLLDTTGAQKATESWYDDSTGNVNLSALFSDLNTSIQTESMEFIGKDSNAQVQSISIETKDGQNISVDLTSPTEWAASFYNPTANTSTSYMADGTNITKTDSSGTIIIGQDSAGSLASILPTGSLTSYSDAGGFWNNIVSDDKTFTLGTAQS